jgi:pimeloyl-ACP methyl ester carboxylesterase
MASPRSWPRGFALNEVSTPVRVLHGNDDLLVPATHGRYLAAKLPHATYQELEAGHLSVLDGFVALVKNLADGLVVDIIPC